MKSMSVLGRITVSEDALIWAKVRKTFAKKGAKAAVRQLQKIRSEQGFNGKTSFLSG